MKNMDVNLALAFPKSVFNVLKTFDDTSVTLCYTVHQIYVATVNEMGEYPDEG